MKLGPEAAAIHLEMLDKAVDVGISILDEDLTYLYLNSAVYRELGIEPEQIGPGDSLQTMHDLMRESGLLTDEIIEKNKLSSEAQENRGPLSRFTKIMEFADGRTHRLTRTKLPSGHTVSVSSDVTELVEKEKILQDSLYLGKAGYWIYDVASKETWVSQNVIEHFDKKTMAQMYKSSVNAGVIQEDRKILPQAIKEAILSKKDKFRVVHRTRYKTGTPRYAETLGEIIRGLDGKPQKIRGFIKDIHKEHLQSLELVRAKDQALAASQAKSEFLANMSHEIRTPMNGILGMAELLAISDIPNENKEHVDVIYKSANALLSIINDILDFSKIEAGALELDPMPFNLRETVRDVASLMLLPAEAKGLKLTVNYNLATPRHFIGDAGRIRQVLTNLINNAIKFTEAGQVTVDVGVADTRDAANIILVRIKDTGIGISSAKIESIFENFTQADNSTTRLYGGTGLGLSISKKLVEMMNGRIQVNSILGQGSEFTVTIPLPIDTYAIIDLENSSSSDLIARSTPNEALPRIDDSRTKVPILVAEDFPLNQDVIRLMLANSKFTPVFANNGQEVFDIYCRAPGKYVAILMDISMPLVDGYQATKLIHDFEAANSIPFTPIIALTGHALKHDREKCFAAGMNDYLAKPVRQDNLLSKLEEWQTKSISNLVDKKISQTG